MSVSFHFQCLKCDEYGGAMAKGHGNWNYFEMIESFKFIAFHIDQCGYEYIRVVYDTNQDKDSFVMGRFRQEFLEKTKDVFPNSPDWVYASKIGYEIKDNNFNNAMKTIHQAWLEETTRTNDEVIKNIEESNDGA